MKKSEKTIKEITDGINDTKIKISDTINKVNRQAIDWR